MDPASRLDDADIPLGTVVDALCADGDGLARPAEDPACRRALPSRDALARVVESIRSVLFPGYFGRSDLNPETLRYHVGVTLDAVATELTAQVERGLAFACGQDPACCRSCEGPARETTARFLHGLPEVRRLLALDVRAAFDGDPAASSPAEAIFCYPGMLALTSHRIAHELHLLGVPLIPRIISEDAHSRTGIDIHPGARIGERMFIDHGTGVVIGETSVIGDRVRIYQGVTLGAKGFPRDDRGHPIKGIDRHPIIEDDVVIYSGATILGRVRIGAGSIIGGNVWLTRSLSPGSRISQACPTAEAFENGAGI